MDRLHTLMNTRKLKKPAVIEAALELLYDAQSVVNDKKLIVHPASQTIADEEVARNQEAFKETLEREITANIPAEMAFHLGAHVRSRNNRYQEQGEMAGVKESSEKVDIRSVMRAFRNKAKNRAYDEDQEKYFHLLTDEFKSRLQ
jgi:hypothetical protein